MKVATSGIATLLLCSAVSAQHPAMPYPPQMGPGYCGPLYYNVSPYPSHIMQPPCAKPPCPPYQFGPCGLPFNGILPRPPWASQQSQIQGPVFGTHPYARSPRDYWMLSDIEEDYTRRLR